MYRDTEIEEKTSVMQKCDELVKTLDKGIKPKTPTSNKEEVKEMVENDEQCIIISHQTNKAGDEGSMVYQAEMPDGSKKWIKEIDVDAVALDNYCHPPEKRRYNLRSRKKGLSINNFNLMLCSLMLINIVKSMTPQRIKIELGLLYRCNSTKKIGLYVFQEQQECPKEHIDPLTFKPSILQFKPTEKISIFTSADGMQ